jgi:hypothetical protein
MAALCALVDSRVRGGTASVRPRTHPLPCPPESNRYVTRRTCCSAHFPALPPTRALQLQVDNNFGAPAAGTAGGVAGGWALRPCGPAGARPDDAQASTSVGAGAARSARGGAAPAPSPTVCRPACLTKQQHSHHGRQVGIVAAAPSRPCPASAPAAGASPARAPASVGVHSCAERRGREFTALAGRQQLTSLPLHRYSLFGTLLCRPVDRGAGKPCRRAAGCSSAKPRIQQR